MGAIKKPLRTKRVRPLVDPAQATRDRNLRRAKKKSAKTKTARAKSARTGRAARR